MLFLPYECHRAVRENVERMYPAEGCGILLGRRGEIDDAVTRVLVCANVDSEPGRRYAIAPEALIAAQRQAREENLQILGFYHSHPDHPAEASATDLKEAEWTGCLYLICSVEIGKMVEVAAWRVIETGRWQPERVQFGPRDR